MEKDINQNQGIHQKIDNLEAIFSKKVNLLSTEFKAIKVEFAKIEQSSKKEVKQELSRQVKDLTTYVSAIIGAIAVAIAVVYFFEDRFVKNETLINVEKSLTQKIDSVNQRIDKLEVRFDKLEQKVDKNSASLSKIEGKLDILIAGMQKK